MGAPRTTMASRRGFLVAAGLLVVVAVVVGTRLAPAIGYDLAFLPAVGGVLGGAVAPVGRRPRAVLIGTVVGIIVGALAIPAYFSFLSAWWN